MQSNKTTREEEPLLLTTFQQISAFAKLGKELAAQAGDHYTLEVMSVIHNITMFLQKETSLLLRNARMYIPKDLKTELYRDIYKKMRECLEDVSDLVEKKGGRLDRCFLETMRSLLKSSKNGDPVSFQKYVNFIGSCCTENDLQQIGLN